MPPKYSRPSLLWILPLLLHLATPAVLFGPKERPVMPFYKDSDGYFLRKETLAVYDGRLDKTTDPSTTVSSAQTSKETTSEDTSEGATSEEEESSSEVATSEASPSTVPVRAGGNKATGWKYEYNVSEEMANAARHVANFPSGGIDNNSLVNDDLIAVSGIPPINPIYRDRTDPSARFEKNITSIHDGWQISARVRSRSKRCKNFSCPLEAISSITGIQSCIASTAPGCVLEYEGSMDLLEQASMCCFDSVAQAGREGVPNNQGTRNIYHYSNYTWFLPTPSLAVDLALRGNVSTFARFKRPYKSGFYTSDFLQAGFAITKMNAACADYKWFDLAPYTAKIANPSPCVAAEADDAIDSQLDFEYVDCHGWPSSETKMSWNRTNAGQLIFSTVLNQTNCLTAAGQYQMLTARLTFGVIIHPPPGALVKQKRLGEPAALQFGYAQHPEDDAVY